MQNLRSNVWHYSESNQNLQTYQSQMKCYALKPCGDQRWQDELRFSIWRLFVNNYLLCYWPSIHNSISKVCPKLRCINQRFAPQLCGQELWYLVSGLDIQFNLRNPRTTILQAKKRFQVASYDESNTVFFRRSSRTHCSVVKAVSSE